MEGQKGGTSQVFVPSLPLCQTWLVGQAEQGLRPVPSTSSSGTLLLCTQTSRWAVGRGGSARKWPGAQCCVHLGDPTGSWRFPFLCTPWLGGFFFSLNLLFSFLCGLRVPRELQSSFNRNNTQSFILGYPEFCPSAAPPPNISFDLVFLFS